MPRYLCAAVAGLALCLAGCSAAGNSLAFAPPITVTLPSTITVSQDGTPVIVLIAISSTSETAVVAVANLPAGVQQSYAATDTNPSGTLTFTASAAAIPGTYTPIVIVSSAEQFASTTFTLVVTAKV